MLMAYNRRASPKRMRRLLRNRTDDVGAHSNTPSWRDKKRSRKVESGWCKREAVHLPLGRLPAFCKYWYDQTAGYWNARQNTPAVKKLSDVPSAEDRVSA